LESLRAEVVACAAAQPSKEKRARGATSNTTTSSSDSSSSSSSSNSSSDRSSNGASSSNSSSVGASGTAPDNVPSVQEPEVVTSALQQDTVAKADVAGYTGRELTSATILHDSIASNGPAFSDPATSNPLLSPPDLPPHSPPHSFSHSPSLSHSSTSFPSSSSASSPTTTTDTTPHDLTLSTSCSSALDALYTFSSSLPSSSPGFSSSSRSPLSVSRTGLPPHTPSPDPPSLLTKLKSKRWRKQKKQRELSRHEMLLLHQVQEECCVSDERESYGGAASKEDGWDDLSQQPWQPQQSWEPQQPLEGGENDWDTGLIPLDAGEEASRSQGTSSDMGMPSEDDGGANGADDSSVASGDHLTLQGLEQNDDGKSEVLQEVVPSNGEAASADVVTMDTHRRYAPGKLYHIVRDKKDGEHVLLEAQGSSRFERIVLSSSLLSDHLVNSYMYALRDVLKGM
ncbi:hypothetical protein CLOM_g8931, partial [Closterium sp. NIES-68]